MVDIATSGKPCRFGIDSSLPAAARNAAELVSAKSFSAVESVDLALVEATLVCLRAG